jgi:chorismate synthase
MGQFRFLTGGESHGRGLVAIVEGMVAALPLEEEYINKELNSLSPTGIGKTGRNS